MAVQHPSVILRALSVQEEQLISAVNYTVENNCLQHSASAWHLTIVQCSLTEGVKERTTDILFGIRIMGPGRNK